MEKDEIFIGKAIELSALAVEHGNEPFGAVLVRDGEIVYTNENQIHIAGGVNKSAQFCPYHGTGTHKAWFTAGIQRIIA